MFVLKCIKWAAAVVIVVSQVAILAAMFLNPVNVALAPLVVTNTVSLYNLFADDEEV